MNKAVFHLLRSSAIRARENCVYGFEFACVTLAETTAKLERTEYPTNPFTVLEPRDQEIDKFYLVQERRATDLEAPKLGKSSSGSWISVVSN